MKKIKYPATHIVHWPSGPVHACEKHANQLVVVSRVLGNHVGVTASDGAHECQNCINEEGIDQE